MLVRRSLLRGESVEEESSAGWSIVGGMVGGVGGGEVGGTVDAIVFESVVCGVGWLFTDGSVAVVVASSLDFYWRLRQVRAPRNLPP